MQTYSIIKSHLELVQVCYTYEITVRVCLASLWPIVCAVFESPTEVFVQKTVLIQSLIKQNILHLEWFPGQVNEQHVSECSKLAGIWTLHHLAKRHLCITNLNLGIDTNVLAETFSYPKASVYGQHCFSMPFRSRFYLALWDFVWMFQNWAL